MMAVLAFLWSFLNSPLGITVTTAALGALAALIWRKNKRVAEALVLMGEVFEVVEKMGALGQIPGSGKWAKFCQLFFDAMSAKGQAKLAESLFPVAKLFAERRAWLAKPAPAAGKDGKATLVSKAKE